MKPVIDPEKEFYSNYDETIGKVCRPYWQFLKIGASVVPKDIGSLCEIGIGTGNFSAAVQRINPHVNVTGIDLNPDFMEIAKSKIKGLTPIYADAFNLDLPTADFYISSLTLHHLIPPLQKKKLLDILEHARRGFVNFDLYLPEDRKQERILEEVVRFAEINFPKEAIPKIREKITENDHPITLREHEENFANKGYKFKVLENDFPFVVYQVTR